MARYLLTPTAQRHLEEIREYLAGAPRPVRERVIEKLTASPLTIFAIIHGKRDPIAVLTSR